MRAPERIMSSFILKLPEFAVGAVFVDVTLSVTVAILEVRFNSSMS